MQKFKAQSNIPTVVSYTKTIDSFTMVLVSEDQNTDERAPFINFFPEVPFNNTQVTPRRN